MHFLATTLRRSPKLRARYAELLNEAMTAVAAAVMTGQSGGTVRADVTARSAALVFVSSAIGLGVMLGVGAEADLEGLRVLAHRVVKPTE